MASKKIILLRVREDDAKRIVRMMTNLINRLHAESMNGDTTYDDQLREYCQARDRYKSALAAWGVEPLVREDAE